MQIVPELDEYLGEWSDRYVKQHSVSITRATAEFRYGSDDPRLKGITPEAWEASDQRLNLEGEPGPGLVATHLLPKLYKHARPQLERMVALVCTPNSLLEDDDEAGRDPYGPEGSVHKQLRTVRHRTRPHQWLKAVTVTMDVLREELELADMSELMGKATALLEAANGTKQEEKAKAKPAKSQPRRKASTAAAQG
jgi:hypothetical protein